MRGVVLWPLFLSLFYICISTTSPTTPKINPLQPFAALDIGSYVEEPSGLAFCNSTGHIYAISDSESSQYIYELDIDGSFITRWKFPTRVQDLEGVACDDTRGILYIIEEERRHVSSFVLPIYDPKSREENFLVPISNFSVTGMTNQGVDTGLEGITVDYSRDHLYVSNEKGPKQLLTLSYDGQVLGTVYPEFGTDIGDICYDEVLDILWMVSDQSERLYAMDLTGTILYDYWDLDLRNAEGLAFNHLHDPPIMYIATDPSATLGPPFVPAMFIFEKPAIGTGLSFYDPKNPKSNNQVVECTGCDAVWQEVKALEDDYYARVSQLEIKFLIESAGLMALFVVPVVIVVIIAFVVQLRKYNPALYQSVSVSETELASETTETGQWPEKEFQADFAILVV